MTISVQLNSELDNELLSLDKNIKNLEDIDFDVSIEKKYINQVSEILSNTDLKLVCKKIAKSEYAENLNYEELDFLFAVLEEMQENLKRVKEQIDIEMFFKKGKLIDIKKLKAIYKELGRDKECPNFNFKRLKELFENPPKELLPLDNSSKIPIKYDPFVVRKYLYGIIQMVINHMDLLIGFTGKEGTGKSCACSQDINLIYYLLSELGLVKYKYNLEEMFFPSLDKFLEYEDKFFDERFRILALDEGNELNRQDWQDERVKTFFQRLRRERHNQRIKFICLPQLGELISNIVLSRMNFIFHMWAKDDATTGALIKGFCDMFIVPRGDKIYSPDQKREISSDEIIDALGSNLEDKKKYLKKIPPKIKIKKFKKNNIWGFDKKEYDRKLKDSNKTFTVSKGLRLTEQQAYYYYTCRPPLKEWRIDKETERYKYSTLARMDKMICRIFEENPDKMFKYEKLDERKKQAV